MEFTTIGFLGSYRFEDNSAIRGAILVTDLETKPLEFRVTSSICPQKYQKILYGELLDEHISVELIGLTIIDALQNKPDIILVQDSLLLGINMKQDIPIVLLLKQEETQIVKRVISETLKSSDPKDSSVKIYTSVRFEQIWQLIVKSLQNVFISRNLVEPFNRVENACSDIHYNKRDGN